MKRRNFLVGVGGTAIGASALVGSGAFSRVESDRKVDIAVAKDKDAYLGMEPGPTANGDNYAKFDKKGHIKIDIADQGGHGEGVNSDSYTWFDGLVQLTNQGKEEAYISVDMDDLEFAENAELEFYIQYPEGNCEFDPGADRYTLEELKDAGNHGLGVGSCVFVGIKTSSHSVNAKDEDSFVTGQVTVKADVEDDMVND